MADNASASSSRTAAYRAVASDALTPDLKETPTKTGSVHESEAYELPEYMPKPPQQPQPERISSPLRRKAHDFLNSHPRLRKVWLYVRGPRPKVDLSEPTPFLNATVYLGRRSYSLALEPALIRVTRPFTSPWLYALLAVGYIIGLAFFSRAQSFLTPEDSFIGCTATYWSPNADCGLDGELCGPFDNSTFDFRCPAQCSSVILLNPRTVGNQQVDFVPLLVGGGDSDRTYRGDSFICAAAVQAGLISDSRGGCASLRLTGSFTDFLPFSSHGLSSIGFPSSFPVSFQFLPSTTLHHCEDLRDEALALNVVVTALIFLVLRPKPIVAFWSIFCIGFWHITLFSQPRGTPPLISDAFATFFPALFVAYAYWRAAWRFTLPAFRKAPIEATVWYLGSFWPGVLTNKISEHIPIDRLIASDIAARPGALTAVIVIAVVLIVILINQLRVIRKTGWLPFYLGWYVVAALVATVMALLPGLQFRLHHYILATALIAGTGIPTRLSAIYQGFLTGMFLNGIAAYGFDSILQTADELRRDAALGTALPEFATTAATYNASIALAEQMVRWNPINDTAAWDGFALLVDDVERYAGPALNFSLAALQAGIPHFFRLAFTSDGQVGDFTMPATLWPNGTWVDPLSGPS